MHLRIILGMFCSMFRHDQAGVSTNKGLYFYTKSDNIQNYTVYANHWSLERGNLCLDIAKGVALEYLKQ